LQQIIGAIPQHKDIGVTLQYYVQTKGKKSRAAPRTLEKNMSFRATGP
jgi:hypothetical protein